MAGFPQSFGQDWDDRPIQSEGCLHEGQIIGGQIANDGWEPGLVFKFEKLKTRKGHLGGRRH